jgi:hypothetical protein
VATDKMNDNSMVSLRRSGRGHIDELRLRKARKPLTTSFSPPVMKLGTTMFQKPSTETMQRVVK